jgi:hypothetical protein
MTEAQWKMRLSELEGMFKSHTLTLRLAGELDAARIGFVAWTRYRARHGYR